MIDNFSYFVRMENQFGIHEPNRQDFSVFDIREAVSQWRQKKTRQSCFFNV